MPDLVAAGVISQVPSDPTTRPKAQPPCLPEKLRLSSMKTLRSFSGKPRPERELEAGHHKAAAPQSGARRSLHQGSVLLVDKDAAVLDALRGHFVPSGYDVEVLRDPQGLLEGAGQPGPCCVVLNLRTPESEGLTWMTALMKRQVYPHVVVLVDQGDVRSAVLALKAGAVDVLSRPIEERDLLTAVSCALIRDIESKARRASFVEALARMESLTDREREVCELVAQGKLNKQIACDLGVAEKTVKVHRGRVMQKLRLGSVAELVRFVDLCRRS